MVTAKTLYLVFSFMAITDEPMEQGMRNLVWRYNIHT